MFQFQVRTPPHSLEELLYDMQVKDDVSSKTVDSVIEDFPWSKEFRDDLKADIYIAILRWSFVALVV